MNTATKPAFLEGQKENPVWKAFKENPYSYLRCQIGKTLKKQTYAVKSVYNYLRYVDKDNRGFAYPSQATIARGTQLSPRHVIRCLARLESLELIIRAKKAGHSYYIFSLPSRFKGSVNPLEAKLEEIQEEVKLLKEKALKPHLDKEIAQIPVTWTCHTNKKINKNKIKAPIEPKAKPIHSGSPLCSPSPSALPQIPIKDFGARAREKEDTPIPSSPANQTFPTLCRTTEPARNWYEWISQHKEIVLSEAERQMVALKQKEILKARCHQFPLLCETFLAINTQELALSWFLDKKRELDTKV